MSEALPACATCSSDAVVKNGQTRHRKQNYKCRDCGRQFVEEPQWRAVSVEHRAIIDRLLLEKIPLAAIARAMQVSEQWLQTYVNAKYASLQQKVQVTPKPKHRLTVQMDELWSFVNDKDHEQWVWLAIDADTREIVGCTIGDRSGKSAQALWDSLPAVYRQCAVCYTDFWSSYPVALPSKRHRAVGKETGQTSYIERFNCTLRSSSVATGTENLIVLKKVRKPHWSNLVIHPPL